MCPLPLEAADAREWVGGHRVVLYSPRARPASLGQTGFAGSSWIRGFFPWECPELRKPLSVLLSLHLLPSLCSFLFFSFFSKSFGLIFFGQQEGGHGAI